MWATPDGERRLVAPTDEVAAFVSAVYGFDRTIVSPLEASLDGKRLHVRAPQLGLDLGVEAGAGWRIPFPWRPPWFTRFVEAPVARRLLGVTAYGVSPSGVQEWYRADVWRPLVSGRATLDDRDLGALGPIDPPVRFGFSDPPRRPSMVWVRPLLQDPSGTVDRLLPPQGPRPRRGRG